MKFRDIGTIIIEVVASLLFIVYGLIYEAGMTTIIGYDDAPNLPITDSTVFGDMNYLYNVMDAMMGGVYFGAHPNNDNVKNIITTYYTNNPVYNADYQQVDIAGSFHYFDNYDDMRESFAVTENLGVGFGFENIDDPEWYRHANVSLYQVTSTFTFYSNLAMTVADAVLKENGKAMINIYRQMQEQFASNNPPDFEIPEDQEGFLVPQMFMKIMSKPSKEEGLPINTVSVFFSVVPIILASMPDLSIILQDKETHMMTFIFLMGASETQYYLVAFLSSFLMCFVPYIVVSILFCTWTGLQGTNYVLYLVICILFILSYLCFLFFLSAFFQTQSAGRVLTVIFLVLMMFFGYINQSYMTEGSDAVKYVLSLFPMEGYELILHFLYENVRIGAGGYGWDDFTTDIPYCIWEYFVFQIVDIILWGGLFILLNATLPRDFGAPPLKWRDIIRCRFNEDKKKLDLEDIANGDSILKVDGLTKKYKGSKVNAVDNVSFDIKRGEIIVMIGPNGAGKSTIINTVSGAIASTKGTLSLGGKEPIDQFIGIQNCLGIVFQDNVIMSNLSIKEHLDLFGAIRGISPDTLDKSIEYFADLLQLTEMLPNRAGDLSGGQKRKLCIAMALLGNPPIIIMDEPTAGVDVQARQLIWKTISGLKNSTCIITTHALEEAEAVSSRLFVISNGHLPFVGTSTELRNTFKCGYVLKVDCEPEQMPDLLSEIKKTIPDAAMVPERDDTIIVPVVKEIPIMLKDIYEKKEKFGLEEYSFAVEQLEDVLSRMLESNQFYVPNQAN